MSGVFLLSLKTALYISSRSTIIKNQIEKHSDKFRFMIVGSLSTAIDYGILFALALFGLDSLRGNFISTSIAMAFSFIANKKFTFKDSSTAGKTQIVKFFVITTFGLWIIQPIIIEGFKYTAGQIIPNTFVVLFIGKTFATIASMVWNFVLYKKFVFTTPL